MSLYFDHKLKKVGFKGGHRDLDVHGLREATYFSSLMPSLSRHSPFYSAPSIFAVLRILVGGIWLEKSG